MPTLAGLERNSAGSIITAEFVPENYLFAGSTATTEHYIADPPTLLIVRAPSDVQVNEKFEMAVTISALTGIPGGVISMGG